ncbi:MAG: RDD family protein [Bacilli bacterium]|nr:RDD family protein [Bacilli bacterium]
MKKLFKRFVAYAIDMMVIVLIAQSLSGVPVINKQLDKYNKYYDNYVELYKTYSAFKIDLTNDFEDKELTEEEYNSLIEEHKSYEEILKEKYEDKKLTEKEYKKLNTKVDDEYNEEYKKIYYKIEQNSIAYFVIYLIATLLYFIGFNKYTNGQTLGKKVMRLKIVNSKDESSPVPVWSYLVRTIILYQPIYYIVKLIGVTLMDIDMYYTVTSVFYNIQYYLEILIIIMIMMRLDGRGPHDLLAQTRVIMLDKNGNEIQDKLDIMVSEKKEELKKSKNKKAKKIIDEPSE